MYYKVCCRATYFERNHLKPNQWVSASQSFSLAFDARVAYEIGKWTVPRIKKSKLFVFDGLEQADNFCQRMYNASRFIQGHAEFAVFEAECFNVEPIPYAIIPETNYAERFWRSYQEIRRILTEERFEYMGKVHRLFNLWLTTAPPQSHWCDKVKLLHQVGEKRCC